MDDGISPSPERDDRILFLTPTGRDSRLLEKTLASAGFASLSCKDIRTLAVEVGRGVGAVIVAQEALREGAVELAAVFRQQPPWSDIPVVVLTGQGDGVREFGDDVTELGNVLILERPLGVEVLLSVVRSILRARQRQYLVRDYLGQQLRAEQWLRDERQRFETLIDSLPQLVWSSDPAGECDFVSRQWLEYTGASAEECMGLGWTTFIHEEDREATLTLWREARTSLGFDTQFRLRRGDGAHRWFSARAVPLLSEAGVALRWFGTCTDIDDQKASEAALVSANRLKDELLALVSHELRTPLTQVIGAAEILQKRAELLDPGQRQSLEGEIVREARRLQSRIENMLVLAKSELTNEVGIEPFLLQRVVGKVMAETASSRVRARIDEGAPPVLGNSVFSEQVVHNLIRNAEKYSDRESPIEVTIVHCPPWVISRVADRGRVYSMAEVDHMFEAFYRDEASATKVSGLGLGLPVCRRLAQAQSGKIEAFPRAGGGLVVEYSLPVAPLEYEGE